MFGVIFTPEHFKDAADVTDNRVEDQTNEFCEHKTQTGQSSFVSHLLRNV